jgi:hypothetical protein
MVLQRRTPAMCGDLSVEDCIVDFPGALHRAARSTARLALFKLRLVGGRFRRAGAFVSRIPGGCACLLGLIAAIS